MRSSKEKDEKFWEDNGPAAEIGTQKANVQEKGLAAAWRCKRPTWTKKKIKTLLINRGDVGGEGA